MSLIEDVDKKASTKTCKSFPFPCYITRLGLLQRIPLVNFCRIM